ncbi:MAG: zinc ABC transporter substrate-binding protein [Candidatus Magasanikbacteria bacterium]|jgi:ABC-type Zn uptake system ZnuABC Zn-binding protein ZnuA|nr:zinc ABC transporter substrate-binding protein [Candidatus Magasanikbacteria bacterium]
MKKIYLSLSAIFFLVIVIGAGCSTPTIPLTEETDTQLTVATTIAPVQLLVQAVGGGVVRVHNILPPGTSPHTFEPTPSSIKNLSDVNYVFAIGHELDGWVDGILSQHTNATKIILDSDIPLREYTEVHAHGEETHGDEQEETTNIHGEYDPHYWLSPNNAIIMIGSIEKTLSEAYPKHAEVFATNAASVITELQAKDAIWKQQLDTLAQKDIVTFHDAFYYFADHFGLTVVATFEPFPGKQPTPQYLVHLEEEIKEHGVRAMYIEPDLAQDALLSFAKDQGIRVGILNPEGALTPGSTYIDLIDQNVQSILETNQTR